MASRSGPRVTAPHNLVACFDAGNIKSYDPIKSPTTVNSLVGNITSSSYNSNISHSTSDGGYWSFVKGNTDLGIVFDSVSFMPLGSSAMTYEHWVKFKENNSIPFSLLAFTNRETYIFYTLISNNSFGISKDSFMNFVNSSSNVPLTPNVWRHFIITHDPSTGTVKIYINGSLDKTHTNTHYWGGYGSGAFSYSNQKYQLLRIGGGIDYFTNAGMGGDISIVRIYKGKALTASEVTKNYETFKHRFGI